MAEGAARSPEGAPDLVEWGDVPGGPEYPVDDLDEDGTDDVEDEPWASEPNPIRRNPFAFGLTVAGFVAALAAQYLPWWHIDASAPPTAGDGPIAARDLIFGELTMWQVLTYSLSGTILLALVALAIAAPPARARVISGAALGWVAGHLVMLVGLLAALDRGLVFGSQIGSVEGTFGAGMYAALLSLLLLASAALFIAWQPRFVRAGGPRQRRGFGSDRSDGEPMDLTVTAAHPRPPGDTHL